MHSSLSSLGYVEGGAETVVQALIGAVGPQGTLLFPAHTWVLTAQAGTIEFDVRSTPSMKVGAIPEAARQHPHVSRSLHATHSITAFGRRAEEYTTGHEDIQGQCGIGSPYHRLVQQSGLILLLGCDHHSNTSIHMVEEMLDLPGALLPGTRESRLTDKNGRTIERKITIHSNKERDFMRVDLPMTQLGMQRFSRIGQANSRIVEARKMHDWLIQELRHNSSWLFLEDEQPQ